MSTAPATVEDADAGDVVAALSDAPFVRIVAAADGDSLAASGVLARALKTRGTPFQVRVDAVPDPIPGEDDDVVLGIGAGANGGDLSIAGATSASLVAATAARELGADPNPTLALAGIASADRSLDAGDAATLLAEAREGAAVDRRPGLAVPTTDLSEGLAHSTLVHAPVSGDPEAARAALDDLAVGADPTDEDHRRVASWLAIEATASTTRAAEAVERVLRPHATPDGRFATVEGFADVLDAVARERPGTGVAIAIRDGGMRSAALDAWRTHARAAHRALADATTGRYDGVFVARVDSAPPGRLGTVAQLCRDFRSPEPVALVVGDDGAAAQSVDSARLGDAMREAVRAVDADGRSVGTGTRATARFENAEVSTFITAFREAL
ncbi:hypothetical protein SAMN04488065_0006 [Haloplanus vescus]|uniref:Exonuclease RecJ n=1 Tax=Haloplanus vescus TaxID=555874 RepID=A0A1H3VJG5_9EURY|nr:hypothetical protein [Haloplanus vescus]SDZ74821.1 hypothetical protein SAMN04488065_0006 [Haloplanus vescus]